MKHANLSNKTAIDHLGRELPHAGDVQQKDENKVVGLFYYLWHGYHGTNGPYDLTKILAADPNAMENLDSTEWPDYRNAPMMHWGEPLFGYYLSTDEWVLRRHVQMFIDAGIDVLYFDTTNGFTYRRSYLKLFDILTDLKKQGHNVPKVCFYLAPQTRGCGTGNMMDLWEQLYEPGLYSDLWFYWKGKPLIICHSERAIPDEIRNFFTWRAPTWNAPSRPNTWAWEGNPQKVATDEHGNPEQIAVSVCANQCALPPNDPNHGSNMSDAHWGIPIYGRSFHDGARDERENASHYGFFLQEQMDVALRENPPVAFLCQWNEWLVPFLTRYTVCAPQYDYHGHDIVFRDEFSEEYSRDIEPMKGGYRDAYYLQMVSFCRKFKGMDAPAVDTQLHTIKINRDFSQWNTDAGILYTEYIGDCKARDHKAYDSIGKYVNTSGRNEFSHLAVASDDTNIYFFAETVLPITSPNDDTWMTLFIRVPFSSAPTWEGYHFAVRQGELQVCDKNGSYAWRTVKNVEWYYEDNHIHFSVPKTLLGIDEKCFTLEFKWSDNLQENDVMDFYVNGDSAPRGRMNYIYTFGKK